MRTASEIDHALRQATDTGAIPGVVAISTTDNEITYEGAFGKRDLARGDAADNAMTLDTVFWIASMTKAITATAAMQLVEQGRLRLDDPIGALLPEIADRQVLDGFDSAGKAILRPARAPITLRQLLTHTAGFCYDLWNAPMGRYMEQHGIPGVTTCENKALSIPLASDPGTRWEYGISIDFVGKAVEAASGKKLDAYLKDHILAPLGMKDTGFKMGPAQRSRLSAMHSRSEDGSLTTIPFEIPQEPEFHMGGGGLYGTAPDYIAFVQMLLNGGSLNGQQILKPETVALMGQNHIGDLKVTKMIAAVKFATNDVDLYPEQDKQWGLSFLINTRDTAEGRSAGSLAWAGLANTYFWVDPTRNVGGVILSQLLPFADAKVLDAFSQFEGAVYAGTELARAVA